MPQTSSIEPIGDKNGYIRPTSFSKAICKGKKAISVVRKEGKIRDLTAWVIGRLIGVFKYLGAYGKVTDFQIEMLAHRICAKYFYFTPAELDYFFVAFTNGEYHKLYNSGTINPQDIMMSLIDFEKDLLTARGVEEEKRQEKEKAEQKRKEALKPHGLEAWKIYCKSKGLDPNTHKPAAVKIHDVNEELYPHRGEHGIIKK